MRNINVVLSRLSFNITVMIVLDVNQELINLTTDRLLRTHIFQITFKRIFIIILSLEASKRQCVSHHCSEIKLFSGNVLFENSISE